MCFCNDIILLSKDKREKLCADENRQTEKTSKYYKSSSFNGFYFLCRRGKEQEGENKSLERRRNATEEQQEVRIRHK